MIRVATFKQDVYDIAGQIPAGRVVPYSDVARMAGWPLHSPNSKNWLDMELVMRKMLTFVA